MKILGIETSCDETAISIIEASGTAASPDFTVLGQVISSQTAIHAHWGGVVPSLAKREHAKNIIPVLDECLKQANLKKSGQTLITPEQEKQIKTIFSHEEGLAENFLNYLKQTEIPDIDTITITQGPGLEPALWVGINLAQALALVWHKPVIPVNHMEGHMASILMQKETVNFPAIALLVSGGHTELVLIHDWLKYELVGQTRDDAAGEAFDKVARLLGLPYPGGPQISALAKQADPEKLFSLPRPMLNNNDLDFSFSGLKTAVLYLVKDKTLTEVEKRALALEFETAVVDVLVAKTLKAVTQYSAQTLIVAGGVAANVTLRQRMEEELKKTSPDTKLLLPTAILATDNATMIAMASYFHYLKNETIAPDQILTNPIIAHGNLSFE